MGSPRCGSCLLLAFLVAGTASAQGTDCVSSLSASLPASLDAQPAQASPGGLPLPGLGAVVKEMPRDVWRFLSVDTAIVLGAGGAAAGIAHIWDDDLKSEVENSPQLNDALAPGHTYGAFGVQALIGVGMYGVGWLSDSSSLAVTGADIMRAQLVSQVWVQAIKFTAQRTRPDGSNDQSFPSGHSASAFATAAVLHRHYGWKAGIPAYLAAGYVATARVHDNRHYLSDVVFGAAMGFAGERTVMRSGRYTVRFVPAAGPQMASLTILVSPRP
jgi:PAP2 superfamily protein